MRFLFISPSLPKMKKSPLRTRALFLGRIQNYSLFTNPPFFLRVNEMNEDFEKKKKKTFVYRLPELRKGPGKLASFLHTLSVLLKIL